MTTFYLARHGETYANQLGLRQGQLDDDRTRLDETGIRQVQELARHFQPGHLAALYASPLKRAQETADFLNEKWQLPVTTDQRLVEISYGDWDGRDNATLEKAHPDVFDPLIHDVKPLSVTESHGETFDAVQQRVADFTGDVVKAHRDEAVLVVSHGFTIRSFVANAIRAKDLQVLEPANCSVTKIVVDPRTLNQHLMYFGQVVDPTF